MLLERIQHYKQQKLELVNLIKNYKKNHSSGNEAAANKRRAADFQVTSDPEQRTEKETTDLKRMDADSKPGRGFVEF